MQLSLSCSAQASQLIQSRPSRAGTKPELINLPEPIWVLQESLGTALCVLALCAEGVCAQLCLAPHEGQLCWQGLSNPQSSGELAQTPAQPQASAGLCQGLSERSAAASWCQPCAAGPLQSCHVREGTTALPEAQPHQAQLGHLPWLTDYWTAHTNGEQQGRSKVAMIWGWEREQPPQMLPLAALLSHQMMLSQILTEALFAFPSSVKWR